MSAVDRAELTRWMRTPSVPAGLAQRARIVLLAAEGVANDRDRAAGRGVPADGDRLAEPVRGGGDRRVGRSADARAGRARIDEVAVVVATLEPPPEKLGVTHWSSRLLAEHAGRIATSPGGPDLARVGAAAVAGGDVQVLHRPASWTPRSATSSGCTWIRRRTRSCSASTRSPRSRPWTGPRRSCRCGPGCRRRRTHDYVRHGTTTLFAALEVATGKVTDACYPRHRHQEFLRFLKQVAKAYPRVQAAPGRATTTPPTSTPSVKAWLARTRGSPCTSPRPRRPG